jgi:hypothetical protein
MKLTLFAAATMASSVMASTTFRDLAAMDYQYSLEDLMKEFKLTFSADEIDQRRATLSANLQRIKSHNEGGSSCASFPLG